jgi:copper transport protein
VYPNARPPHLPAWALALALGAAGAFASSAGGALRRRGAPAPAAAPARSSLGSPRGVRPRAGALAGVVAVLAGACALAAPAPVASAHARLVRAEPPNLARLSSTPDRVVLAFSEPVQVVRPGDVRLLDHEGQAARTGGAHTAPRGGRVVTLWLRSRLRPGSWTVRYHVLSADAHTLSGAVVFAAGGAVLLPPAGGASAGPSETSAWAVDSRFAELVALGGLLALLAFRWLVWGPALLRAPGLGDAERTRAALEGRRLFWTAFWTAAAVAGLAEAAVLAVKTDLVFATGLWGALAHPAAAERLVSASRFGDLLGGRGALLCAIAMLSFWTWLAEPAMAEPPRGAGGRALPAVVLALLSAGALGLIAAQGHASQAPLPALSIAFDAVHLGAVAVWAGGLACLGAVLRAAPRVLPAGGPSLAAAVLGRFSRLAAGAVAVIAATGLARAAGELAAPSDLWATPYGRTLILKTLLLAPVAVLAIRHRRAIAALAVCGRPARARLRRVARDLRAELAVAMTIVLVAAVLVGQLPGRA